KWASGKTRRPITKWVKQQGIQHSRPRFRPTAEECRPANRRVRWDLPFGDLGKLGGIGTAMSVGDYIRNSQIWKSIFRHPAPVDRRNRSVVMLTNFFLHLHPVSIKKEGIALSYTWCMGGITFFLFLRSEEHTSELQS